MISPFAEVRRAANRAREASESRLSSLRHGVEEAAEEVVDYFSHSHSRERDGDDDYEDEEARIGRTPSGLDDSSQGEGDSVIAPLLSEQRGRKPTRPRMSADHRRSSSYRSLRDSTAEQVSKKMSNLDRLIATVVFFTLGSTTLLAWNSLIVQGAYMSARLAGSAYEKNFSSWLTSTFTTGNLLFLGVSNFTQHGANLGRRIRLSLAVLIAVIVLFTVSTQIDTINPTLFFLLLLLSTIVLAASASFLQGALVALASHYGPQFMQQQISGQGAIGVAVALVQFVAAWAAVKSSATAAPAPAPDQLFQVQSVSVQLHELFDRSSAPTVPVEVKASAFHFFIAVGVLSAVGLLAFEVLAHQGAYKLVMRQEKALEHEEEANPPNLWKVALKIRHLCLSVLLVFCVTLSVFPGVTSSVLSVNGGNDSSHEGESRWMRLGETLEQPSLFIPLVFAFFALGDWIGRLLPTVPRLATTNWKILMAAAVARIGFIPLFLLCNIQNGHPRVPFVNSDLAFVLIMLLFAISNGWTSTLTLLAVVQDPALEPDEIDSAATISVLALTLGLAAGSALSFGINALAAKI